jgi:DNA mismatch repair protein MutS
MLTADNEISDDYESLNSDIKTKISNFVKLDKTDRDGYSFKMTKSRNKILKQNIKKYNWKKYVDDKFHIAIDSLRYNEKKSDTTVVCTWLENKSKDIVYRTDRLRCLTRTMFKEHQEQWFLKYSTSLSFISELIAEIDCGLSNYNISNKYHYSRPELIDMEISGVKADNLRHPITERVRNDVVFVPNPVEQGSLSDSNIFGSIITGLNGVGKSIYIKSVALSIIMAQSGLYVPADNFKLSVYNKIFTRIGNIDNLFRGQSTFYREMIELDNIIRNADKNSLVIADELCSGSEQISAQAILTSTIVELCNRQSSNLITTHFHDCLDLDDIIELKRATFYHFKVSYKDNDVIYDRNLLKGKGPKLYGIEVATNIISNKQFIDNCYNYRKKILNLEGECHSSKYNSKIKVEKCEICNKYPDYQGELHVHHINEQECADKYDNIDHIKKNSVGNLVVLCKKHHEMVHHGGLTVNGWKQSLEKGKFLDYHFDNNRMIANQDIQKTVNNTNICLNKKDEKDENLKVTKISSKKKYKTNDILLIKNLYLKCKKIKKIKITLETEYDYKSISESIIRKICNDEY